MRAARDPIQPGRRQDRAKLATACQRRLEAGSAVVLAARDINPALVS